jgi:hypothetical protein
MNIVYDEGSKLPRRLASPEAGFPRETLSGNIVNSATCPLSQKSASCFEPPRLPYGVFRWHLVTAFNVFWEERLGNHPYNISGFAFVVSITPVDADYYGCVWLRQIPHLAAETLFSPL